MTEVRNAQLGAFPGGSDYDAKNGRLLSLQISHPNVDGHRGKVETIKFRANAVSSKVTLED